MSQDIQDRLGPVDVVIIEFPAGTLEAAGFEALLDAVNKGVVRVLDIELVSHGTDGSVTLVDLDDAAAEFGLSDLVGASSGLLDDEARSERIGQLIAVLAAEGENSIARADALGLLVGEFTSPLYRQAYRIVGNVEDTKDVVAEVTAKFVCKFDFSRLAGATDPAAVIGAFLRTTTRRTALDTVRLRAKLAPYPEFDDSLVGSFGLSELDATLLRDAVAKLETAHREVVMLRYFLDLTLAEVAVALGVSLTTVKNRLRAALAVLKRLLDDGDSTQGPALSA